VGLFELFLQQTTTVNVESENSIIMTFTSMKLRNSLPWMILECETVEDACSFSSTRYPWSFGRWIQAWYSYGWEG